MQKSNYKERQKFLDASLLLDKGPKSFENIFHTLMRKNKRKTAALYFDEDDRQKTFTYKELEERVRYISRHLNGLFMDFGQDEIIALKIKNSPDWPVLFWAVLESGFSVLLIDARMPKENTENLLKQSGAKAIIATEETSYSVPLLRLNDIVSSEEKETSRHWGNQVLFCSSGTTGDIKMMVMDGENMIAQIQSARILAKENATIMPLGPVRILAMVPFHHIFGFIAVFLWYSYFGKTIVYPNSIASKDIVMALKKGKVTHLYSVPLFWDGIAQKVERSFALKGEKKTAILEKTVASAIGEITQQEAGIYGYKLFRNLIQKKVLGNRIVACISGGGYLQKKTLRLLNGIGYPLVNGYGMTEIGVASVEYSMLTHDILEDSIGKGFGGFEFKLEKVPGAKDNEGELLIRSKTIHKEEIIAGKRQRTSLEDGFFRTGDIASIAEDGRIFIHGRIKDTIISSNGENVYPDEIEAYFANLPHVLSLASVGMEEEGKENIYLVIDLDNSISEEELPELKKKIDAINATLPSEKKISKTLISKKSLPMANNMKVKRFALKNQIRQDPDAFYDFDKKEHGVSFSGFDEKEVLETMDGVRKIFSKILLLPEFKIGNNDVWNQSLGGDSMTYITMINDLNDCFGVEIPMESYGKIGTVSGFAHEILLLKHKEKASKEKEMPIE